MIYKIKLKRLNCKQEDRLQIGRFVYKIVYGFGIVYQYIRLFVNNVYNILLLYYYII